MCCCGKPVVNGETGYRWQPNDAPTIRQPHAPALAENDVLVFDEPGRCGGLDCHSHHFRVVTRYGSHYLLAAHGGGEERFRLFSLASSVLKDLDSNSRYWMLHAVYSAHNDGAREASDHEAATWRKAAAEGRLKTRKQQGQNKVTVWIEQGVLC